MVAHFCLVAERSMIINETMKTLDDPKTGLPYIDFQEQEVKERGA